MQAQPFCVFPLGVTHGSTALGHNIRMDQEECNGVQQKQNLVVLSHGSDYLSKLHHFSLSLQSLLCFVQNAPPTTNLISYTLSTTNTEWYCAIDRKTLEQLRWVTGTVDQWKGSRCYSSSNKLQSYDPFHWSIFWFPFRPLKVPKVHILLVYHFSSTYGLIFTEFMEWN